MILSERSSDVCLMHGDCSCGAFDDLGLGRFRMRTFIYSPPLLGVLDSERQKVSLLMCMLASILSLGKGLPLWLPNTDHDSHDLEVLKNLVPLGFLSQVN